MMSDSLTVQRITVDFETLSVPPPYSYRYSFNVEFNSESLQVQYSLAYTDRDELSQEEIWEEGFSNQDDFGWKGNLPEVWRGALLAAWQTTHLVSEEEYPEPLENSLVITASPTEGQSLAGIPKNLEDWEYLLQELTQAVYEAAQREHPLQIRYLERLAKGKELQLSITIYFLDRSLKITQQQGQKKQSYNLPWSESEQLLRTLYQLDFHHEYAKTKLSNRPGKYLDPGDGRWYPLQQGVTNPGKSDYLGNVLRRLTNYQRA